MTPLCRFVGAFALVLGLAVAAVRPAVAQTPTCDKLSPEAKAVAGNLLASEHPYDCCDDTIARCLTTRPDCTLVRRLADYVCRLAAAGKGAADIGRSLERRALSMLRPQKTYAIDTSAVPVVGCDKAPVRVVAYACARCPFCSKLLPALHREVTAGRLVGQVGLWVRLFPIKSHAGSTEANIAAQAALKLGKFWEYLLHAYRQFDAFTPQALPEWAAAVGLDGPAFAAATQDPTVRARLVDSKKEGLTNQVDATPTLFINGRKYVGDLDLETLVDVLEEEREAVR